MTHDDDKPLTPAKARQKLQKSLEDYMAGNDTGPFDSEAFGAKKATKKMRKVK